MSCNDPILHADTETLSFCQIDRLNRLPKGTAFRLFKAGRQQLIEDQDYFYLPAATHSQLRESLKASGQVYSTTINLVLLTRAGYARLRERQKAPGSGS